MRNKIFIAEIGNNHFGRLDYFKELIDAAFLSGADIVKAQLFNPMLISGSMPQEFYEQCSKIFAHLEEVTAYARAKKIPLYFSCFDAFEEFDRHQIFKKVSASQARRIFTYKETIKKYEIDRANVFISIPADVNPLPKLKHAVVMHVSDYLPKTPNLTRLGEIQEFYDRIEERDPTAIGYSDHTVGIQACLDALYQYKVTFIEKHFTLAKNMDWQGHVFRDTVHGSTPKEFFQLTRRFK